MGLPPATSVHELLECPVCTNSMYPPIHQGKSAISVDDTLKIIGCREQQKKLTTLEMDLAAARQEGFVSKHVSDTKNPPKKSPLVVIGVLTGFGRKNNREVIRKAWMSTGAASKKMEDEKGVIARFVIGKSANRGDSLDRGIDIENKNYNDFFKVLLFSPSFWLFLHFEP